MKKSARIISLFLSMTLSVSMLSSCASKPVVPDKSVAPAAGGSSSVTEKTAGTGEKTVIRVWQRNSGKGGPLYELFQEFNASQDEIEVKYEGFGENYSNIVNMALNSDDPPDIFEIQSTMAPVADFAESGFILPLDEMVTEDFKKQFIPSAFAMKDFYYDNHIYAVPLRAMHFKLLYNKDLFKASGLDPEKPPETLEQMKEYAKIITEKGGGKSYGLGIYLNYAQFWLRHVDTIAVASGDTSVSGFDFKTGKFDFTPEKKYFDYWLDIQKSGYAFPGAVTLGIEQMRANFAQGNVGMMIDGNWMCTQYAMNIPTEVDWEAAPIPVFEGTKRAKDYISCDITFAIAQKSKNAEAAKKVYQYLLENQVQMRKFGEADTKTFMAANEKASYDLLPKEYVFRAVQNINMIDNSAAFPIEPQKFIKLEGDSRDAVFNNEFALAIDGKGDLDSAMEDLAKRYNGALEKSIAEGNLNKEDLAPAGFDYYTR